jgi:hypothetical protein
LDSANPAGSAWLGGEFVPGEVSQMSVMGNAYPALSDQQQRSGSPSVHNGNDARWDTGPATDLAAVLEENARLRALVVKLSDIVLRSVIEQK